MATQGYHSGFWNDPVRECRCTPPQIQRYVGRLSISPLGASIFTSRGLP